MTDPTFLLSPIVTNILTGLFYGRVRGMRCYIAPKYFYPEDHVGILLNGDIQHVTGTGSQIEIFNKDANVHYFHHVVASASASGEYNLWKEYGTYVPIILTEDCWMNFDGHSSAYCDLWTLDWDIRLQSIEELLKLKLPGRGFWDKIAKATS